MILFFDTETSGLPKRWNASSTEVDNWPRVVQFAWILTDFEGNQISEKCFIVKPEGYEISQGATNIHGITTQYAIDNGHSVLEVLKDFANDVKKAKLIVAHNLDFDRNVISAEFYRGGYGDLIDKIHGVCTMKESTKFCALPGNKWPKLEELHLKLFGEVFKGAHDALVDIRATLKCFWKLNRLDIIKIPIIKTKEDNLGIIDQELLSKEFNELLIVPSKGHGSFNKVKEPPEVNNDQNDLENDSIMPYPLLHPEIDLNKLELQHDKKNNKNSEKQIEIIKTKLRPVVWKTKFPGFFDFSSPKSTGNIFEIDVVKFTSLRIIHEIEIPYKKFYLILDENRINDFYRDIYNLILLKVENVREIQSFRYIYSQDFSKVITDQSIFVIPRDENKLKVHKKRNYQKYFVDNIFRKADAKKDAIYSEYIGFTGKSNEQLSNGEEIKCELFFADNKNYKIAYIYISNISKVLKKMKSGQTSEYFIMPSDFMFQVQNEINEIIRSNEIITEIKIYCKFFDESINDFVNSTTDNFSFERTINHFFQLNYTNEIGLELMKNKIEKKGISLESNRIGQAFRKRFSGDPELDYLDYSDNFDHEDWRSEYYGSMF
jgi:DNA polymerase-3 subunit epsilon